VVEQIITGAGNLSCLGREWLQPCVNWEGHGFRGRGKTHECVPRRVRASPCARIAVCVHRRVRASPCACLAVCVHRRVRASPCACLAVCVPRRVRASPCARIAVCVHRRVRASPCARIAVCVHRRVRASPWKSGPSGPRKLPGMGRGFSPGGRLSSSDGVFSAVSAVPPRVDGEGHGFSRATRANNDAGFSP
jgi:hypothetical protein